MQFQFLADRWRPIYGLTDEQLVQTIQADQIDILVDLAGHTAGNRLLVFARRAAPVQITYYPTSTGLQSMQYRFTDSILDPKDQPILGIEKPVWQSPCFLCYSPDPDAPLVQEQAGNPREDITFGSFNNLTKLNPSVISLWADILLRVPHSRLLLKARGFHDAATYERFLALFETYQVPRSRIQLVGRTASIQEHLNWYHPMDIALDPFPYNGMTTTCEALWMGVPVIALAGDTHFGRASKSILTALDLKELVTSTWKGYSDLAVRLAKDRAYLSHLRQTLRLRMQQSPLCDAPRYTQGWETAYRVMWKQWCYQQEARPIDLELKQIT